MSFPLDRAHALLAVWGDGVGNRYERVSKAGVREINRRTIRAAERFVFGPYASTPLDRLVQEHIGTAPHMESTTLEHEGQEGVEYLMHSRLVYGNPTRRPAVNKSTA